MKAAVDSNILFDLLSDAPRTADAAERVLSNASVLGPIVLCPVVFSELGLSFAEQRTLEQFLNEFGIELESFSTEALRQTSRAWGAYLRRRGRQVQCSRCGRQFDVQCPACQSPIAWRQHLISDFLIGGHAAAQADALITRDQGYYRTYFPQLTLVVP